MGPCTECTKNAEGMVIRKCPRHELELEEDLFGDGMEDTQVTGEADVAKLERLTAKRDFIIATPGQSPVLEPILSIF